MDMNGELQSDDNAIELDMQKVKKLKTQFEVDAYSGNSTNMEPSFDSFSDNFNETKTERTILTTFKREKSEADSRERKKKKVKFCNLGEEKCPPEDRVFPGAYLFTQPVHDSDTLHKSSSRTELGMVYKRKGMIVNKCDEQKDNNNEENGGKFSDVPNLGKSSKFSKTDCVEKENLQNLLSDVGNDYNIKKTSKMSELSHGGSLKRIGTHFIDEIRPSKFAKRLTGLKHGSSYSAPSDPTDSTVVLQSPKVFDTELTIKTSGSSKRITPIMQKIQGSTNERRMESKFNHSLGSIMQHRTEANAFVQRKNAIEMEQKKLSCDNTNLPRGNTKVKPVVDLANKDESTVLGPKSNQSRIPKKIEGIFAGTGHNLRSTKTHEQYEYAHDGEEQLIALNNLKEETLVNQKCGSAKNNFAKCVPVIVKSSRPRMKPSRFEITSHTKSNFTSGDSSSRSSKTGKFELCSTEFQPPNLVKNRSDSSLLLLRYKLLIKSRRSHNMECHGATLNIRSGSSLTWSSPELRALRRCFSPAHATCNSDYVLLYCKIKLLPRKVYRSKHGRMSCIHRTKMQNLEVSR
ncbi:hypothetical protein FHG87_009272 [Trinorchestia longiramus]|nr:hypothetical protein FHG87_009272 [Trinorchestia longiramus]